MDLMTSVGHKQSRSCEPASIPARTGLRAQAVRRARAAVSVASRVTGADFPTSFPTENTRIPNSLQMTMFPSLRRRSRKPV